MNSTVVGIETPAEVTVIEDRFVTVHPRGHLVVAAQDIEVVAEKRR